jgi:siroheme synthase-like protein
MPGYPILLNLHNRRVVIVGGGRVAARKLDALLEAGACVTIISPSLHPKLVEQVAAGRITHLSQPYTSGMLTDLRAVLVFAATDSSEVNHAVTREADLLGILVNNVDHAQASGFSSMVTVQRPPITVALATGGTSPALSAHLKTQLEASIGEEYALLARWLGDLRPLVKAQLVSQSAREQFWKAVIDSDVLRLLREGGVDKAYQVVHDLLDERVST